MTTLPLYPRHSDKPLKTYRVDLWPLEGCDMQIKAHSPGDAKIIAGRAWLADDITAFLAEPDYWTVEEVLTGKA